MFMQMFSPAPYKAPYYNKTYSNICSEQFTLYLLIYSLRGKEPCMFYTPAWEWSDSSDQSPPVWNSTLAIVPSLINLLPVVHLGWKSFFHFSRTVSWFNQVNSAFPCRKAQPVWAQRFSQPLSPAYSALPACFHSKIILHDVTDSSQDSLFL